MPAHGVRVGQQLFYGRELAGLDEAIAEKDQDLAMELSRVRGVGPTVIQNAWTLLMS